MRSKTFLDFDEFAESVRDVDSKMMLRNPERRSWKISGVTVDSIDVQVGQLCSGNIAQGQLRDDGYMFYLPTTDGVEYVSNGTPFDLSNGVMMEPGSEFCFSTKAAHNWIAIFLPNEYFARGGSPIELLGPSQGRCCRVTAPNRRRADRVREVVKELMATASQSSSFESSVAAKGAGEAVFSSLTALAEGLPTPETKFEGRPKVSREEVIRRSMQYLEEHSAEGSPLVGELATAVGVSERTLRTVFQEYFGTGPVRYLQLRRLHQVRRALKAADSEVDTVAQILMDHGEWAFSRFASRYRRLFGELPSDTLKS